MNALDQIFARKRLEVVDDALAISLKDIQKIAQDAAPTRGFARALENSRFPTGLIAEIKRASPVAGELNREIDPASSARIFAAAGAQCLSVLTDGPGFGGSPDDLVAARAACDLPVLRKDFTTSEYHVYQARAMGADAILLIVNGLSASELGDFRDLAQSLGMDAIFEVHSEAEIETALGLKPRLVGVNNRDLETFETNLFLGERLLPLVAPHAFAIGESAMHARPDVERMERAGARAVLIGTAFSKSPDPGAKIREVMGR